MENLNPDQLREALLKLEMMQFAKVEAHVAKEELREYLRADAETVKAQIASNRKKLLRILAIGIPIIVGGDIWTVVGSVRALRQEVRSTLRQEVDRIRAEAALVLNQETARIRQEVRARLAGEFEAPRIRHLVEQQAQEYTKKDAQSYIAAQVKSSLVPLENEVSKYRKSVNQAFEETSQQREISMLGDDALAGSRASYDRLTEIAHSQSTHAEKARQKIGFIIRSLAVYRKPDIGGALQLSFHRPDGRAVLQNELSVAELFSTLSNDVDLAEDRRRVMGYLTARPKEELITPALAILRRSEYLPAIAATCGVLLHVFGERATFMDIARWSEYLEQQQRSLPKKK